MRIVSDRSRTASLRGALALFGLGMVGVAALAAYTVPSLRSIPELADLSVPVLLVIAAANSAVLLAVFVALGTVTAPRAGLRSHVYAWATGRQAEWGRLRDTLGLAVAIGVATFFVVAILDVAFAAVAPVAAGAGLTEAASLRLLAESVPMRLFYGGITEELLLRWGLMAPIAWAIWRARSRLGGEADAPDATTMWVAIVVSALVFGAGHLPALAASVDLTAAVVVRTVVLNAVAGISFGWLFWRRSLEAAMVAHAAFHVALVGVSAAVLLVT